MALNEPRELNNTKRVVFTSVILDFVFSLFIGAGGVSLFICSFFMKWPVWLIVVVGWLMVKCLIISCGQFMEALVDFRKWRVQKQRG